MGACVMNPQTLKVIFLDWFDLQDQTEIRDLNEWVNDLFHYMRASTSDDELSDEMSDWAGLNLVDETWF
jgi:hypothetical protein